MRQLVIATLFLGAAVLEVTVLPRVTPFGLFPDFVLGIVLVASAFEGLGAGVAWAIAGGVLFDLLTASPLGAHVLALLPAVFAGSAARRSMYRSALLPLMGLVGGLTLAYRFLLLLVRWPGSIEAWLDAMLTAVLVGLLNVIAVPIVYGVVALLGRSGVRRAH